MKGLGPLLLKRRADGRPHTSAGPSSAPSTPIAEASEKHAPWEPQRAGSATPLPPSLPGSPLEPAFPHGASKDDTALALDGVLARLAIRPWFDRLYHSAQQHHASGWRGRERVQDARPPPLHMLPAELVLDIFMLGARDDPDFAITASHIDRRCRTIAINYPLLWTNIQLEGSAAQAKAKGFLQRSQHLPVDIYLRYFSQKDADVLLYVAQINDFRRLFKEITAHAHRWRIASFDIRDYDIMTYAARALPPSLPLLERILLRCRTAPHTPQEDHVFYLFPSGPPPRLRHVDFDAVNARWEQPFVRGLETLRLVRSVQCIPETVAQLFATFRASPGLRRLQLEMLTSAAPPQTLYAPVTLAQLDILILWKVSPDVVAKLLEHVRCPALRVLELQLTSSRRNIPIVEALGTGVFPLGALHMLGLGACDYPPDLVYSLLRRLPTLKAIRVIGGSLPHALLQGLSGKLDWDTSGRNGGGGGEWLVPALESLQIKSAMNITDNDICKAVARRYRNRQTQRIRTVWLGGCPHISPEIGSKLAYYKAGVAVVP